MIQKQDYLLDWSRAAIALHNQVRGFFPNCTTTCQGQLLKITATVPLGAYSTQLPPELTVLQDLSSLSAQSGRPGEVVSIAKGIGPVIQTGEGLLLLREVQLAGKRPQSGWDFANGTRLTVGEVLESFES